MDTKKLATVIQKIVEREVDKKTKPLLKELNSLKRQLNEFKENQLPMISENHDPFQMADEILDKSREQGEVSNLPRFSKNDKINKVLWETIQNPIDMRYVDGSHNKGMVGSMSQPVQQQLPRTNLIPRDVEAEQLMLMEQSQMESSEDYRTVNFNSNMVQGVGTNGFDKRALVAKMGYGNMVTGGGGQVAPQTGLENRPINTADPNVQKTQQIINRDYSALMKKFKK